MVIEMLVSVIGNPLFGFFPPLISNFAGNLINLLQSIEFFVKACNFFLDYEFSLQVKNHLNREILIVSHPPHLGNLQNEPNIRRVPEHPTDLILLQ